MTDITVTDATFDIDGGRTVDGAAVIRPVGESRYLRIADTSVQWIAARARPKDCRRQLVREVLTDGSPTAFTPAIFSSSWGRHRATSWYDFACCSMDERGAERVYSAP
jgi:hypothetical protein